MATTKEITIYTRDENGFLFKHIVSGRNVLLGIRPEFSFYIHKYIGPHNELKFTISELTSGHSVCHDNTERACIRSASNVLNKHTYERVKQVIDDAILDIKIAA